MTTALLCLFGEAYSFVQHDAESAQANQLSDRCKCRKDLCPHNLSC